MKPVVPYELEEIKNELKRKAIDEFGLVDAEFEGSNVSQLINLLAYSTVVNNTNLSYGLNEMFISQATDRKNIIKHGRQMGYTHKRNLSYQYKIKLQCINEGQITLPKYSNFSSNGNNYVYLGEDLTDTYGTNVFVKALVNEDNNGQKDLYGAVSPGSFLMTKEGTVNKVLEKSHTGSSKRLLLERIQGDEMTPLSETYTQAVYVYDDAVSVGYRDFVKVGTVDTFLRDDATDMFKVQITLDPGQAFPIYRIVEHPACTVQNNILSLNTSNPIKSIKSITLTKSGDIIVVDTQSLERINNAGSFINNVRFAPNEVNAEEIVQANTINNEVSDKSLTITTEHRIVQDKFYSVQVNYGDNSILDLYVSELTVNYGVNSDSITIPRQVRLKTYSETAGNNAINNGLITIGDDIESAKLIVAINGDGSRFTIDNYSFSDGIIKILLEDNETVDNSYDNGYDVYVDYESAEDLEAYEITLNYSYLKDLTGYNAVMEYTYDHDEDGLLDKNFFFGDLRGEYLKNEKAPNEDHGWGGFRASSFDEETNVLYFDVSYKDENDHSLGWNNEYVQIVGADNEYDRALPLDIVMKTPFEKTRLYMAEEINTTVGENEIETTYKIYENLAVASINLLDRKNEIEIIVKEGNLRRYTDDDADDLNIKVNNDMVREGYFTIFAPSMEHNGIELFISRIMPDGSIEYDTPWTQRQALLAEHTDVNKTAKPIREDYETDDEFDIALLKYTRERVEETFMVTTNLEYEDYINIYTKYAGTGVELTADFIIKLNILDSKGAEGKAAGFIEPVENENFIGKYYIDTSFTPFIMQAEGTNVETTESIRENAPKFSNTANRAVTKKDYKTICEAQPFISAAQVWGGEEVPKSFRNGDFSEKRFGHIYFSIIPYSRPVTYTKKLTTYLLDNFYENELFFPSYAQITGKESYTEENNNRLNDTNVLFSVLNNYKIITLQLDYVKAVYLDMSVNVDILKYKFGQTIIETNEQIFKSARTFAIKEIEQFDSTFYLSSLIKHTDGDLGDSYGLNTSVDFSTNLYDDYNRPELGTFVNRTMSNISSITEINTNPTYDGINYPGYEDEWSFEMPIAMPLEDLFDDDFITDFGIIQRGGMNIGNITNCNTDNFCVPNDRLYMELDDGTFVSHNLDGVKETQKASSVSSRIEVSIMYDATGQKMSDGSALTRTLFKVGSYIISKGEDIIMLKINTHGYKHFLNPDVHNSNKPEYIAPTIIGTKNDENGTPLPYEVVECAMPREYFMNTSRKMNINPKNNNIKVTKNVYPRLKQVEFTSK